MDRQKAYSSVVINKMIALYVQRLIKSVTRKQMKVMEMLVNAHLSLLMNRYAIKCMHKTSKYPD